MCDNVNEIKFCTCGTITKKRPNVYYWELLRLVGIKETKLMGKIAMPQNDLGNNITMEQIENMLNTKLPFDFEYIPKEKDTITISLSTLQQQYQYFILIYRNGIWQKGRNPPFSSITKKIAVGIVEYEKKNDG